MEDHEAELILDGECIPAVLRASVDPEDVAQGLSQYLEALPRAAHYFGVELDEHGRPRPDDVQRAAGERVILYADL